MADQNRIYVEVKQSTLDKICADVKAANGFDLQAKVLQQGTFKDTGDTYLKLEAHHWKRGKIVSEYRLRFFEHAYILVYDLGIASELTEGSLGPVVWIVGQFEKSLIIFTIQDYIPGVLEHKYR